MAEITASMVMDLRSRTGLPMMECKRALAETGGDATKAEELLRVRSGARASKAADRIAAEGVIGAFVAADGKTGAMVEVNCETDFVARNADFVTFARKVGKVVAEKDPGRRASLSASRWTREPLRAPGRRWCRRSARTCRSAASSGFRPQAGWRSTSRRRPHRVTGV